MVIIMEAVAAVVVMMGTPEVLEVLEVALLVAVRTFLPPLLQLLQIQAVVAGELLVVLVSTAL
jgi:hypothetical protein